MITTISKCKEPVCFNVHHFVPESVPHPAWYHYVVQKFACYTIVGLEFVTFGAAFGHFFERGIYNWVSFHT